MTLLRSSTVTQAAESVVSVPIGGLATGRQAGSLRTFLGSCVGLALYDRRRQLAGLAHIVLPDSAGTGTPPGKYADTAVPALVAELTALAGGEQPRLTARLIGGAKMFTFQSGPAVGDQNVEALEKLLDEAGIPVIARDCGGSKGRRMTLDISNGKIAIESVGTSTKFI